MKKQNGNIFCFLGIFGTNKRSISMLCTKKFAVLAVKQYLCHHFKKRFMDLKCPQCGKWMAVSQEELVIHGSQVVCPQCLVVCQYENGKLVPRDDSDAPYRHNASVQTSTKGNAKFCHSCGRQLPGGISFCPYCGANLTAPFKHHEEPKPASAPVQPAPEPVKEKPKPKVQQHEQRQQPSSQQQSSTNYEDKLRTMTRHYNNVHPHLHQHGTMPSKTFKVIAYIVIALLIILLIGIIIAGNSIESNF